MQNAKQLLNEVSEKLKIFEESQKESGELFNIFSITKIERREVDTHSAMIAELLNPRGRHGQDDRFLIEFLKIVIPAEYPFTGTKEAKVFKEKSFDKRSRIDILIVLDNHVFVIENKIDAEDGHKQLQRYKEILDSRFKQNSKHLLYLTIDGSEAEKYSHCGVPYHCISYEEHILNWLASCIEASNTQPTMKYALKQYQHLVEKITGKSMNHKLNNELVKILIEGDNLKAAQKISKLIQEAKGKILFDFFGKLEKLNSVKVIARDFLSPKLKDWIYDEGNCCNWFNPKDLKQRSSRSIGVFFDIGIPDILFRVEVATRALYYGAVPVENNNGEYELAHNWSEFTFDSFGFEKKDNWEKTKWFAIPMDDAIQVWNDIELIRGENEQNFIDEVCNSIEDLRKAAEKVNE